MSVVGRGVAGDERRFSDMSVYVGDLYIDEVQVTATAAEINSGVDGLTATAAELNRTSDISARIVTTTATALSLTVTEHAERVLIINTNDTVASTFSLPAATGSGAKFEIVNGITQTQGSIVIAANGTDVMIGRALSFDSTAVATHANFFLTTATSDKITWNITTTGGLGQDRAVLYDQAANTWRVFVECNCSGSNATPFSQT